MGSPSLSISSSDVATVVKNALLVGGSAVATYLLQHVIPGIPQDNQVTLILVPTISFLLHSFITFVSDTQVTDARNDPNSPVANPPVATPPTV